MAGEGEPPGRETAGAVVISGLGSNQTGLVDLPLGITPFRCLSLFAQVERGVKGDDAAGLKALAVVAML